MVIGLYEKFFFQSDVGGYPMFDMPSLLDMPGFLSMRARGKQPMRSETPALFVSAKPVLRSGAKAVAVGGAAAASKAVGVAAAASKAFGVAAAAKQAIAAEENALALEEAAKVWKNRCGTYSKSYHPVTRMLNSLLVSIPAKGKLALQAGVLTHTRTPAHPHTRTCA